MLPKKIPHNGLWNKALNGVNSLISMILVLSYQNDYRSRRVTDLQRKSILWWYNCIHKLARSQSRNSNSPSHVQSFLYLSFTLSSVLVSSHSFPFWVFVLHLCFSSPAHTSDSLALLRLFCAGIAGPQNLFKSKRESPNDFSKLSPNSDPDLSSSLHQDVKIHLLHWTLQIPLNAR